MCYPVADTPSAVNVTRISLTSVMVDWSSAQTLPGIVYEVFYQAVGSDNRHSKTSSNLFVSVSNLSPLLDYSLFIVAYGSSGNILPSAPSNMTIIQSGVFFLP